MELVDLGHYRLRDFDAPVALYQVGASGQLGSFPAIRAVPADHHNIVVARTSFVGRQREVADIGRRLAPGRIVTIAGTGGMGKTRLATEIGLQVAPAWADGVWLVDLSSVTEASLVVPAVASALGAPSSGTDRLADVLQLLAGRRR